MAVDPRDDHLAEVTPHQAGSSRLGYSVPATCTSEGRSATGLHVRITEDPFLRPCVNWKPKERTMQTYIFTVVLTGEDVQGEADQLRDEMIDSWRGAKGVAVNGQTHTRVSPHLDVYVTEAVRVTP